MAFHLAWRWATGSSLRGEWSPAPPRRPARLRPERAAPPDRSVAEGAPRRPMGSAGVSPRDLDRSEAAPLRGPVRSQWAHRRCMSRGPVPTDREPHAGTSRGATARDGHGGRPREGRSRSWLAANAVSEKRTPEAGARGACRAESAADRRGACGAEGAATRRVIHQYRRRGPRPPKRQLKEGAGPEPVGGSGPVPRHGAPEHRFSRVTVPVVTTPSEWRRPLRGSLVQRVTVVRPHDWTEYTDAVSRPGDGICIYHCCNIEYV